MTPTADVSGDVPCTQEITVTATDSCGNSTTKKCTAHVDGTDPTLTVDCGALAACHADNAAAIADVLAHSKIGRASCRESTPTAVVAGGAHCKREHEGTA